MPTTIVMVHVSVPVAPPPKRRPFPGGSSIELELMSNSCRVWDNVTGTDCAESYRYQPADNPLLETKPVTDIPFFGEVFKHLCGEYAANRRNPLGEFLAPAVTAMEEALAAQIGSCVYFAEADSQIKIGHSRKVATRIAHLQTGSPVPLRLLAVIPGGKVRETAIHSQFATARVNGEWFTATPELLAFIDKEAQKTA